MAKVIGGDSLYLNGIGYDIGKFKEELQQIAKHMQGGAATAG